MNKPPSNQDWDNLLSGAAQLSETDQNSTQAVLSALKLERQRGTDPVWTNYLSHAVQLRPVDLAAINPTLAVLRRERQKRKLLRLNLTRAVAGLAAAAVAAVTLVVFSPSASADPSEAYSLYQEANIGW
jgi:hypothetical protein